MTKFSYIVFYTNKNYNQNKTYYQNANRYARHTYFTDLQDAKEFAKTVNNAKITLFNNTMYKIAF